MAEPASVENLMEQIADEYESLSRQLKVIAKYIEQHKASLMLEKISDIAAACDVQPSAIVRFAQRFGFTGFSEMQDVFRQSYTEQANAAPNYQQRIRKLIASRDDQLDIGQLTREFIDASRTGLGELSEGLDDAQLEAAVTLLQKADNIYVVGVRRAFPVASYIAYALQNTNKRVHLVNGLGGMYRQQIRSVRERDVVIAISFAPYGQETQYCARVAHHQRAKLLVITDSKLAPLARVADALLTVTEGSAFAFRSLTSTLCLCQALFIALAYKLELDIEETQDPGGYDD
ncbi:MurR/RpiR family transcriptional regulator [Rugamonas apoptosis]|uniref:MurR/RpiR family transcriptional regulator n=1 Tax=Rugamonas apoptosis TaxID=2758570 RepID=A0A7W2IN12_9BURK|nr:MurR/RpiR family transcriptional regulator [Rugamonas apoptosis]MBA5690136.1 MurR/RpiR family transcriptional regulator [Rugamonas apoptosis]